MGGAGLFLFPRPRNTSANGRQISTTHEAAWPAWHMRPDATATTSMLRFGEIATVAKLVSAIASLLSRLYFGDGGWLCAG